MSSSTFGTRRTLGDGPKRSGGYHQEISAIAGVDPGLLRLAEQLKRQYVIEYSLEGAARAFAGILDGARVARARA